MLPKLSALLFYSRVFNTANRSFKYAVWIVEATLICWFIINMLVSVVFFCDPVQKAWLPMLDGQCKNFDTTSLGTAVSIAVVDLAILILPFPVLWKLHLKLSRKLLISGVFVCGYW